MFGNYVGKKCFLFIIAKWLLIVGGINWGLVGVGMLMGASWNLVNLIFGSMPMVEAIVYILVAISAIIIIFSCKCNQYPGGVCPVEEKVETV